MTPHLVVDLSGHGYGHAGITSPVLNVLRRSCPEVRVTIRSTIPAAWLAQHLDGSFDYLIEPDFGMAMAGTMHVLPQESIAAYQNIHKNWAERVDAGAAALATLKPTLLLSNISYLSLAAARQAKIPAIAFSAVNWADIFYQYCIDLPGAQIIWKQMVDAYASAELFLQPTPGMLMPSISNRRQVGPVAYIGRQRRDELHDRLGLSSDILVVLLALGGIPTNLSCASWPRLEDVRVVLGSKLESNHPDVISCDLLDFPFIDLVRSSDVIITKPGYGLVTEAACNGTPLLLLPRKDWPETPAFVRWLRQHGRMLTLAEEKLHTGEFLSEVHALRIMPSPPIPAPSGTAEVAAILADRLS